MIHDSLDHADRYTPLHPGFERAIDFLRQPELFDLEPGRYEIDGDNVFAMVVEADAVPREAARLEGHHTYIDIQYVITGGDTMGWLTAARASDPDEPYDPERDLVFYPDAPESWITVSPGEFAVFWPEDLHAPMVGEGVIHKVVVKVKLD